MPCGLRSLLIVSWFSFIVTYPFRLVFWDDLRRPVYEMNDDERLDDHTYMIVGLRAPTVSTLRGREGPPASAVTAAAVS